MKNSLHKTLLAPAAAGVLACAALYAVWFHTDRKSVV